VNSSNQGEEAPEHLLVQRTAQGDHEAFEMLVRRHQQSVANLAYRFLADASEAEDIAQETFIRFYLAIARYQPDRPLRPYLLKIARNLCLDHLRKKKPVLADNLDTGATTRILMPSSRTLKCPDRCSRPSSPSPLPSGWLFCFSISKG